MKLCVLVPSDAAARQAGARIRYRRIERHLASIGCEMALISLEQLNFQHDVYLFSKCYDTRSVLAAHLLKRAGKTVGIDLFDDYFSQAEDSRLVRFQKWIRSIAASTDFVLCSTPAIRRVSERVLPGTPSHVMNDPTPEVDVVALGRALKRKIDLARSTRVIKLCWFGMGDNAHFPVGLSDLAAFGGELARLEQGAFRVELAIQTNERALQADALARLQRLPLPFSLAEWSEEREGALLSDSLACFLPVNAQSFSVVKSLNRATSALASGVQVLSSGYPLYEPLSDFLYRDPTELLRDVGAGTLRLRAETAGDLARLLGEYGDPERESIKLKAFLDDAATGQAPSALPAAKCSFAVVHGAKPTAEVHAFTRRFGALSVASPFCPETWSFDVVLTLAQRGTQIEAYLADDLWPTAGRDVVAAVSGSRRFGSRSYRRIDLDRLGFDASDIMALGGVRSAATFVASYPAVMGRVQDALGRMFPDVHCLWSDRSVEPLVVNAANFADAKAVAHA